MLYVPDLRGSPRTEWMSERTNKQTNKSRNEPTNARTKKRMNKRMNERTNGLMNVEWNSETTNAPLTEWMMLQVLPSLTQQQAAWLPAPTLARMCLILGQEA